MEHVRMLPIDAEADGRNLGHRLWKKRSNWSNNACFMHPSERTININEHEQMRKKVRQTHSLDPFAESSQLSANEEELSKMRMMTMARKITKIRIRLR